MARGLPPSHSPPRQNTNPFVTAQLRKLQNYPRQDLPRYLFRAYSVDSQGKNEATLFTSAASHHHAPQRSLPSLSELDLADFAQDAKKHLTYTRDDDTFKSPLISFTSSLLVALGCARKADFEGGTQADVKIAILDTQKITSVHPIVPCADLKNLVNTFFHARVLIPGDSVDEWLAYDSVEVEACTASFQTLKTAGLFEFLPELYPRLLLEDKWPKPTLKLRRKLFAEPRFVSEGEHQLVRQLSLEFPGEEYQLALTVHLLSMRHRFVDTDDLLKKAVTASFRMEQMQNFVRVDGQFDIGPGPLVVYKYTSAGHGVHDSTAPELRLYSALVSSLCDILMARQEEKIRKTTQESMIETICNPAADAYKKLDHAIRKCDNSHQPLTDAREAWSQLDTYLPIWRKMHFSEILDHAVLRDIISQTETAKRLAADLRALDAPSRTASRPPSTPGMGDRRPIRDTTNKVHGQARRIGNTTSFSVFGSILASMDSPKKRKRADEEEDSGRQEEVRKLPKKS